MRQNIFQYIRYISIVTAMMLLAGGLFACSRKAPQSTTPPVTLTQQQKQDKQRSQYRQTLKQAHVTTVLLGETYRVIIPDNVIFEDHSANLRSDQQHTLATLVKLMNSYSLVEVNVAAFTDDRLTVMKSRALSKGQAQTVADYLRRQGVDARLIASQGYGQQDAVASNKIKKGQAFNRRVEVTFRVHPVRPMY